MPWVSSLDLAMNRVRPTNHRPCGGSCTVAVTGTSSSRRSTRTAPWRPSTARRAPAPGRAAPSDEAGDGPSMPPHIGEAVASRPWGPMLDYLAEVRPDRVDEILGVVAKRRLGKRGPDEDQTVIRESSILDHGICSFHGSAAPTIVLTRRLTAGGGLPAEGLLGSRRIGRGATLAGDGWRSPRNPGRIGARWLGDAMVVAKS